MVADHFEGGLPQSSQGGAAVVCFGLESFAIVGEVAMGKLGRAGAAQTFVH